VYIVILGPMSSVLDLDSGSGWDVNDLAILSR
jgi:hypothetical protein